MAKTIEVLKRISTARGFVGYKKDIKPVKPLHPAHVWRQTVKLAGNLK